MKEIATCFLLANDATADAPSIVAAPGGDVIAYSRIDDANGRAPRVFMRTLECSNATPPRRRSARH